MRGARHLLEAAVLCFSLIAATAPVEAQPRDRPQRPFRGLFGGGPPPDPNRTRQELSLTGTFVGGYDDDIASAAPGIGGPQPTEGQSGYLGQGSLDVRYYRGRTMRSFTVMGNAYALTYTDTDEAAGAAPTSIGGSVSFSALSQMRRQDMFRVSSRVSYDPLFALSGMGVLEPNANPVEPTTGPNYGLFEFGSVGANADFGYNWNLGRRRSVDLGYAVAARRYTDREDDLQGQGDGTSHRASAELSQTINRSLSFRTFYSFGHASTEDSDGPRPMTEHSLDAGLRMQRRVSATRTLSFSFGAGAQYVRTLAGISLRRAPIDYWNPFATVTTSLQLGASWDVTAHYRRGSTAVPELTTDSFITDAVNASAGGLVGSRLELGFSGGFSTSRTPTVTGSSGRFRNLTAGTNARIALTRNVATTVDYTFYDYKFEDVADLPEGFNPDARRNAVRIGVTIWLPLYGRYADERGGGRGGGRSGGR
jgi:hypothetical protein